MKIEDLIKGTILEEIFEIAMKGNFGEALGVLPLREDEVALCEATPLEKACRVYIDAKNKEAGMVMRRFGIPAEDERVQVILRPAYDAGNIMRALLQERLGNKTLEIRQGWQVVEIVEHENCGCLGCRIKNSGGFIIIDINKPESFESEQSSFPPSSKMSH